MSTAPTGIPQALFPNLDRQMSLQLVDFYASRGMNVVEARKQLLAETGLDEAQEACFQDDLKMLAQCKRKRQELEAKHKENLAAAQPLLKKYFVKQQEQDGDDYFYYVFNSKWFGEAAVPPQLVLEQYAEDKFQEPLDARSFEDVKAELFKKYKKSDNRVEIKKERGKDGKVCAEVMVRGVASGNVDAKAFNALIGMAETFYDTGAAKEAAELLEFCSAVKVKDIATAEQHQKILWGALATNVMAGRWTQASSSFEAILKTQRETEDKFPDPTPIVARSWLLHWALFVYFKASCPDLAKFLDVVYDKGLNIYQRVIETTAPHMARYVSAAALLLSRDQKKRFALRYTANTVKNLHEYRDALTEFIYFVAGTHDLQRACDLLGRIGELADGDYFLHPFKHQLVENAQKLIFEDYIKVHRTTSIASVASDLNMEESAVEVWLADLLREAKIVAKIDSVNGEVIVRPSMRSIPQHVLEKLEQVERAMN
jgi:translation initiation factor 3 subunit E